MIKFTIVTVTYNAAGTLPRTAASVLTQTYRHVEHLIIDGASADATVAVAEAYKAKSDAASNGHTVAIVSEPDRGIYDAMNKGLERAVGDYVLFLNAGDFLPAADTIETVIRCGRLEEMPSGEWPAVLYGDTNIVDDEGRFLRRRRLSPPEHLSWRSFLHGMLVCHQAFYARTDVARGIDYDLHYRYSADVDWCIRVMKEAHRRNLPLCNLHAVVVNYTEEGQTTLHHKASLRERYRVMCRHYGKVATFFMHCWFVVRSLIKY
jgi:glycosyltransferase involved in cell wall biosynthesis